MSPMMFVMIGILAFGRGSDGKRIWPLCKSYKESIMLLMDSKAIKEVKQFVNNSLKLFKNS